MNTRLIRLFLLVMCIQAYDSQATEIYRWVDEAGRTHISNNVPEHFKSSAKRYDSRTFERTNEQKQQGSIEADRARRALGSLTPDPIPSATTTPDPTPATPDPAPLDPDTADCDALHLRFKLAQECYTPYRNRDGTTRGQAFQDCTDVPAPPRRCGLQNLYR